MQELLSVSLSDFQISINIAIDHVIYRCEFYMELKRALMFGMDKL